MLLDPSSRRESRRQTVGTVLTAVAAVLGLLVLLALWGTAAQLVYP